MRYVPLVVAACLALSLPPLALHIESKWLSREQSDEAAEEVVDYVVVLGYALKRDGEPTEVLQHRVRSGVRLWRKVWRSRAGGCRLVFSGGHPGVGERGNKSEAEAMRGFALRLLKREESADEDERVKMRELAKDSWVLESLSTSTRENALFSLEKIEAMLLSMDEQVRRRKGMMKVAIVTSPFHQFRSLRTFGKARQDLTESRAAEAERRPELLHQLDFFLSRVPEEEEGRGTVSYQSAYKYYSYEKTINVFREIAAIVYYKARGWIELT